MLALISGRKRKELLMSNKTRVGWFIWGYLDVYWRRLFNCVLPLGTQQNAIEVLYLLSEETLAHERRYIQLHDHNLIVVYKYKDVDVFISDVYRQERQQKTSCRHNKKETNGREYESLFTQLKSSILKLRKHQSDALSLIAKDSGVSLCEIVTRWIRVQHKIFWSVTGSFPQKGGGDSCVFKTLAVFSSYSGNLEPLYQAAKNNLRNHHRTQQDFRSVTRGERDALV